MKVVQIINNNFDRATDEELAKIKMRHKDVIEVDDPLKVVRKIYNKTNLNVLIKRNHNEKWKNHVTIFVTMYDRFSQR